jgi:hypothetical protein
MPKHQCANRFQGEGAKGACLVEIEPGASEGMAHLVVGWSCVYVHQQDIPISWLSEIIAIASGHQGGISGFLAEHKCGGGYALVVDPPKG